MNRTAGKDGLHPALMFSQDFSTLTFGEHGQFKQWVPNDWKGTLGVPTGVVRAEQRVVSIAYQATISAAGGAAPFMIIVKAPKMKGERQIMKVHGIGGTSHPDEYAYLVVDKDRRVI